MCVCVRVDFISNLWNVIVSDQLVFFLLHFFFVLLMGFVVAVVHRLFILACHDCLLGGRRLLVCGYALLFTMNSQSPHNHHIAVHSGSWLQFNIFALFHSIVLNSIVIHITPNNRLHSKMHSFSWLSLVKNSIWIIFLSNSAFHTMNAHFFAF